MSTLRLKACTGKLGTNVSPTSPKPTNMFYIWYSELCRRANQNPLSNVKPAKPKHDTVLDFVCDRIKAEEWIPVISALKQDTSLHVIAIRSRVDCKFLYDIDTEKKVKDMKRKGGFLHTHYILTSLINAICNIITRSKVLTYLELDGIPITNQFLTPLLEALAKNKSIKVLSFKHCPLKDEGCQSLCSSLRYLPNIEILNLTGCGLGSQSAQSIGKVIRHQQINRYCESWHCSLRYEDPDVTLMKGLKRITLNNNPGVGDEGLTYILNELDDDLWIKAIDMQKCNITERIAKRLVDVIEFSKSIEIADFRHNNLLSDATIGRILEALKEKQQFTYDNEYEWCLTATSLPYEHSVQDCPSYTSTNLCASLQKSKSAPFRDVGNKTSVSSMPVRRIKTCSVMPKIRSGVIKTPKVQKDGVVELTAQLQREIIRRMETERENKELLKRLEMIQSVTNSKAMETKNVKFDIINKANLPRTKECLNIKIPLSEDISKHLDPPTTPVEQHRRPRAVRNQKPEPKPAENKKNPNVEFVFTIDDNKEKNVAQSLFENLMFSSRDESDSDGEKEEFFSDDNLAEDDDEDSASNVSLLKFMETIKGNTTNYNALNCGRQRNRNWESNNKTSKVH